ncbi:hypothetical protein LZ554_009569 [Drepanopeziza brunnea f. sp. 'monogermtubi']|nr:hypothetical protein LZ554_009569 [Drepanopeziza brunnea f. sp. 'monogermtubi']
MAEPKRATPAFSEKYPSAIAALNYLAGPSERHGYAWKKQALPAVPRLYFVIREQEAQEVKRTACEKSKSTEAKEFPNEVSVLRTEGVTERKAGRHPTISFSHSRPIHPASKATSTSTPFDDATKGRSAFRCGDSDGNSNRAGWYWCWSSGIGVGDKNGAVVLPLLLPRRSSETFRNRSSSAFFISNALASASTTSLQCDGDGCSDGDEHTGRLDCSQRQLFRAKISKTQGQLPKARTQGQDIRPGHDARTYNVGPGHSGPGPGREWPPSPPSIPDSYVGSIVAAVVPV